MLRNLFVLLILCLSFSSINAQDIATARTALAGDIITITGIVTNHDELGPIRYVQDATAGLPVYSPAITQTWNPGDEVTVTGRMGAFMGLIQIDSVVTAMVNSTGNTLPAAQVITEADLLNKEAEIVTIEDAVFDDGGATFISGTYSFVSPTGDAQIYIRADHPLVGQQISLAPTNITGISSQFNGTPQLLPRGPADLVLGATFYLTSSVSQTEITPNSFKLNWTTNAPGNTNLRYGLTPSFELGDLNLGGFTTNHEYVLGGLQPATFYYVQAYSSDGTVSATQNVRLFSTASTSSGSVVVKFNNEVDWTYATGPLAQVEDDLESDLINNYINKAQSTIDMCAYNCNRYNIVDALEAAEARGVRVRYIGAEATANLALSPAPTFPFVLGNSSNLMHNKFVVIDAEDAADCIVWTGSMNFTTGNIFDDYNNVVIIQDQALARAYVVEFEEMWGSSTETPNIFFGKFGNAKTDNTPHQFIVGGILVENYFSPSDNTTNRIVNSMNSADDDLQFAVLSFTKNEIGDAIIDARDRGVNVRGMMESINDTGSEFPELNAAGINIMAHSISKDLHHKYAIIDATNPASDPMVITGSHNWSSGAEFNNDENTLIIHDATVANLFLQEFEKRWCEQAGTCTVGTEFVTNIEGLEFAISPNPASDYTVLNINASKSMDLEYFISNSQGQITQSGLLIQAQGEINRQVNTQNLAPGSYYIFLKAGDQVQSQKLQIIR